MSTIHNKIPRVIVTSVGAWSDNVGSNTLSELFKEYSKDKLTCLCIWADISESDVLQMNRAMEQVLGLLLSHLKKIQND